MNRVFGLKKVIAFILPMLLVLAMLPSAIFADEAVERVEVRLKAGSNTVKINGAATTVEAPFIKSGTTMVPLRIITNAFGAGLKLENGSVITLTYNDRKVVLTFGSKTVTVNGKKQTVAIAPVVIKNSTMVPLRIIVEAFGAKITTDAATKETVIVGQRAASSGGETSIDSDSGKTKVGDSYGNWSMNYPVGLIQVEQSDSGNFVRWADAKEDAQVLVITEVVEDGDLSTDELREKIKSYFDESEFVTDQRTVTVGGLKFEKIVSNLKADKTYYEYRGIQQGETFYLVAVGITGNDKSVLNGYQALLDSFKPSYSKTDKTIKDITKVKNGVITFVDKEYGLTLQLPVGWYNVPDSAEPLYVSKEGIISLDISSVKEGDTLAAWAARREKNLRDSLVSSYIRNVSTAPLKMKDGDALVLSYQHSGDQKSWFTTKEVMLVSGDYRYEIDFISKAANETKFQQTFSNAIASLDIDTDFIAKQFGLIESDWDNDNRTKRLTKRSSTYGYSIDIFASWTGEKTNFNDDEVLYFIDGGYMNIYEAQSSAGQISSNIASYASSSDGVREGLTIKESTTLSIGGKTGTKTVVHVAKPINTNSYTQYVYAFDWNGASLIFEFIIEDAYATERNLKMMNDVVQSIRFN